MLSYTQTVPNSPVLLGFGAIPSERGSLPLLLATKKAAKKGKKDPKGGEHPDPGPGGPPAKKKKKGK